MIPENDEQRAIQMDRIMHIFEEIKKFNSEFESHIEQGKVSLRSVVDIINLLPELDKKNIYPGNAYMLTDKSTEALIQTLNRNISMYIVFEKELRKTAVNDLKAKIHDIDIAKIATLATNLGKLDKTEKYITAQDDKSIPVDIKFTIQRLKELFLPYKRILSTFLNEELMIASNKIDNCGNKMKSNGITRNNFDEMISETMELLVWIGRAGRLDGAKSQDDDFFLGEVSPLILKKLKNSISTCNDALSKAKNADIDWREPGLTALVLKTLQREIDIVFSHKGPFEILNLNTLLETSKQVRYIVHIARHKNENNTLEEKIELCRLQLIKEQNDYGDVNGFIDEIKAKNVTNARAQEIQTALQKYKINTEDLISDLGKLYVETTKTEDKKLIKTSIEASKLFVKSCNYVINMATRIANNNNDDKVYKEFTFRIMMHSCKKNMGRVGLELPGVINSFELIANKESRYDNPFKMNSYK